MKQSRYLIFIMLTANIHMLHAQSWEIAYRISQPQITHLSIDKKGNVYAALRNGSIYKYENARESLNFSPDQQISFDHFEAWAGLRILSFNENLQHIYLIDRFLANFKGIKLAEMEGISYISAATLNQSGQIIAFDQSQMKLLTINPTHSQLVKEVPLQSVPELRNINIRQIKAVGKHIILLADESLIILDNFGNFREIIPIRKTNSISYWDDKIYFKTASSMISISLTDGKTNETDINTEVTLIGLSRNQDYIIGWNDREIIYFRHK